MSLLCDFSCFLTFLRCSLMLSESMFALSRNEGLWPARSDPNEQRPISLTAMKDIFGIGNCRPER